MSAGSLLLGSGPRFRLRNLSQAAAYAVLGLGALLVVGPVVLLFGYIAWHGIRKLDWAFLTQAPDAFGGGGIGPAIVGTALLVVGTILLALPLGIGGAIYLVEYAGSNRLAKIVRGAIVNLSGVPSIVHGLFGLGFFVLFVGRGIDRNLLRTDEPVWGRPCLLWGAATLAVVILPIIVTTTEEALRSVPRSFREGSEALGATQWQTIRRIVLPAALPGILTGAILGIGRAAGETAPVMITCAASFMPNLPQGLADQAMLLPYHLYFIVTQVPNTTIELKSGIAFVLIAIVGILSSVGISMRTRMRHARKW